MCYSPDLKSSWIHPRIVERNDLSRKEKVTWGALDLAKRCGDSYKTDEELGEMVSLAGKTIKKCLSALHGKSLVKICYMINGKRLALPLLPKTKNR